MVLSVDANRIISELDQENIKLGDIKKIAKEIKKDHDLAMELWATGELNPCMLAVLIMDKKQLTQELIDQLVADMHDLDDDQQNKLSEWFLANQLMKDKKSIALIQTWEHAPSSILRRLFWYHQGRLRWTGQTPPENSVELLESLEKDMGNAEPNVQWAMNFCAGWIGVFQPELRPRCIKLGEKFELYKGDPVARNCTPDYLPEFISIEAAKREK
ncbi:MAG: DNA alkylation repair protein [Anaerolineae bacterium]